MSVLSLSTTPDHIAALHILEAPLLAERAAPYIDGDQIDWEEIYRDLWLSGSHAEQLLIDTAYDLFGGVPLRRISPREVVTILDGENFNLFCDAIFGFRRSLVGIKA